MEGFPSGKVAALALSAALAPAALLAGCAAAGADAPADPPQDPVGVAQGTGLTSRERADRAIVAVAEGYGADDVGAAVAGLGGEVVAEMPEAGMCEVEFDRGVTASDLASLVSSAPCVDDAVSDAEYARAAEGA